MRCNKSRFRLEKFIDVEGSRRCRFRPQLLLAVDLVLQRTALALVPQPSKLDGTVLYVGGSSGLGSDTSRKR